MPDDWNCYWYKCECGAQYHASVGCDCSECETEGCENRVSIHTSEVVCLTCTADEEEEGGE